MANFNSNKQISGWKILIGVIVVLAIIGIMKPNSTPKCIKSGCDNDKAYGSSYCYLHKPYSYSGSTGTTTNRTSNTSTSTYSNSSSAGTNMNNSSLSEITSHKETYHDTYDDGYDDVYYDQDYDYDRYNNDSDYANGVDDAMDEMGEDW